MKTKRQTKLRLLFKIAFLSSVININAQVTIGSDLEPNDGTLLDMKESIPLADNTTSTKGIILPRVFISKVNPDTHSTLAASIGANSESYDMGAHTGLTVYNLNKCLKNTFKAVVADGAYVWSGEEWINMSPDDMFRDIDDAPADASTWGAQVLRHYDQSVPKARVFYSADFGAAGRWMITNLAANRFDPVRTPDAEDQIIKTELPTNSATYNDHNDPAWFYPYGNGSENGDDATIFNGNNLLGLMYNWHAAVNSKEAILDEAGLNYGESVNDAWTTVTVNKRQGICPNGWHLPTDYEWTELENEMIRNTSKYSDSPDIYNSPADLLPQDNNQYPYRGLHGRAMKGVCESYEGTSTDGISNRGTSHHPVNNGFSINLVFGSGYREYGVGTGFWTSSPKDNSNMWSRSLIYASSGVDKGYALSGSNLSVRCKKD
ncbi:FISUMP domain-containing protein [Prevotella sp. 10(H)]|uniref:FISUMP domain-containing protein n=1 Tax=Prevotella sp. 10(H) TaxID=1158294 RepID=UPI0004A6F9E1|nr:FISUMP domain-containing protein [Prevotella sp. 10(H)]